MENFFVQSEFILEKFQFDENLEIPSVKNINVETAINIYEGMRDFFPKYQEINQNVILAPKLENILDNFDALLLDAFGVLNVGSQLVYGVNYFLGVMLECVLLVVYLKLLKFDVLQFVRSITDACINIDTTKSLLAYLYDSIL